MLALVAIAILLRSWVPTADVIGYDRRVAFLGLPIGVRSPELSPNTPPAVLQSQLITPRGAAKKLRGDSPIGLVPRRDPARFLVAAAGAASSSAGVRGQGVAGRGSVPDSIRNSLFVVGMGSLAGASWWITGKFWTLPLFVALPAMLQRLWSTRGDTTRLAEVSASVDTKYVAVTEEQQQALHSYMCGSCGYTLFPARNREATFFGADFKCPMCGAPKSEFFDLSESADQEEDVIISIIDGSSGGLAAAGGLASSDSAGSGPTVDDAGSLPETA